MQMPPPPAKHQHSANALADLWNLGKWSVTTWKVDQVHKVCPTSAEAVMQHQTLGGCLPVVMNSRVSHGSPPKQQYKCGLLVCVVRIYLPSISLKTFHLWKRHFTRAEKTSLENTPPELSLLVITLAALSVYLSSFCSNWTPPCFSFLCGPVQLGGRPLLFLPIAILV